jgi:DNA replication licensing factor MCM2
MSDRPLKRRRFLISEDDDETFRDSSDEEEEDVRERVPFEYKTKEESEDEGEDIFEDYMRDYQEAELLDRYDPTMLDDAEYAEIDMDARLKAEEEIARRRQRESFLDSILGEAGDEDDEARAERRGLFERGPLFFEDPDQGLTAEQAEMEEEEMNLEAFDVSLEEWISQDRTRREIKRRMRNFLNFYREEEDLASEQQQQQSSSSTKQKGRLVYHDRIRQMCLHNLSSLEISYSHLLSFSPTLAVWLVDHPLELLTLFDAVLEEVVDRSFPDYMQQITPHLHARVSHLLLSDSLRDLRHKHINALVKVTGVVTRRSTVYPLLASVVYKCSLCGHRIGPITAVTSTLASSSSSNNNNNNNSVSAYQLLAATSASSSLPRPHSCPNENCSLFNGTSAPGAFRLVPGDCEYRYFQRIFLQESPSQVKAGRVPRSKEVLLMDDLIDRMKPGEEVDITGIYQLADAAKYAGSSVSTGGGKRRRDKQFEKIPIFSTFIFANHIQLSSNRQKGSSSSSSKANQRQTSSLEGDESTTTTTSSNGGGDQEENEEFDEDDDDDDEITENEIQYFYALARSSASSNNQGMYQGDIFDRLL